LLADFSPVYQIHGRDVVAPARPEKRDRLYPFSIEVGEHADFVMWIFDVSDHKGKNLPALGGEMIFLWIKLVSARFLLVF